MCATLHWQLWLCSCVNSRETDCQILYVTKVNIPTYQMPDALIPLHWQSCTGSLLMFASPWINNLLSSISVGACCAVLHGPVALKPVQVMEVGLPWAVSWQLPSVYSFWSRVSVLDVSFSQVLLDGRSASLEQPSFTCAVAAASHSGSLSNFCK